MKCQQCGNEMGESLHCSSCGFEAQVPEVREMTRAEQADYDGVTVDEQGNAEQGQDSYGNAQGRSYHYRAGNSRIYVRGIQLGHHGSWMERLLNHRWVSRILVGLVIAAVAAILFFVALPVILMIVGIGIVVWLVMGFFQSI